jgi:hypothetical protein
LEGDTRFGRRHTFWKETHVLEGDTRFGRRHTFWKETHVLEGDTRFGRRHTFWKETHVLEGDTRSLAFWKALDASAKSPDTAVSMSSLWLRTLSEAHLLMR